MHIGVAHLSVRFSALYGCVYIYWYKMYTGKKISAFPIFQKLKKAYEMAGNQRCCIFNYKNTHTKCRTEIRTQVLQRTSDDNANCRKQRHWTHEKYEDEIKQKILVLKNSQGENEKAKLVNEKNYAHSNHEEKISIFLKFFWSLAKNEINNESVQKQGDRSYRRFNRTIRRYAEEVVDCYICHTRY